MDILLILWFVFVVLYFIGMTISWIGSILPQSIRIMLGELLDIAAPPNVRVKVRFFSDRMHEGLTADDTRVSLWYKADDGTISRTL